MIIAGGEGGNKFWVKIWQLSRCEIFFMIIFIILRQPVTSSASPLILFITFVRSFVGILVSFCLVDVVDLENWDSVYIFVKEIRTIPFLFLRQYSVRFTQKYLCLKNSTFIFLSQLSLKAIVVRLSNFYQNLIKFFLLLLKSDVHSAESTNQLMNK